MTHRKPGSSGLSVTDRVSADPDEVAGSVPVSISKPCPGTDLRSTHPDPQTEGTAGLLTATTDYEGKEDRTQPTTDPGQRRGVSLGGPLCISHPPGPQETHFSQTSLSAAEAAGPVSGPAAEAGTGSRTTALTTPVTELKGTPGVTAGTDRSITGLSTLVSGRRPGQPGERPAGIGSGGLLEVPDSGSSAGPG